MTHADGLRDTVMQQVQQVHVAIEIATTEQLGGIQREVRGRIDEMDRDVRSVGANFSTLTSVRVPYPHTHTH